MEYGTHEVPHSAASYGGRRPCFSLSPTLMPECASCFFFSQNTHVTTNSKL